MHGQRQFQGEKREKKRKRNYRRQQTMPPPTIGTTPKGRTSWRFQRHGEGWFRPFGDAARIVQIARAPNTQTYTKTIFCLYFFFILFIFNLIPNRSPVDMIIRKKIILKRQKSSLTQVFFFVFKDILIVLLCFLFFNICLNTKFHLNWLDNNKKIILKIQNSPWCKFYFFLFSRVFWLLHSTFEMEKNLFVLDQFDNN